MQTLQPLNDLLPSVLVTSWKAIPSHTPLTSPTRNHIPSTTSPSVHNEDKSFTNRQTDREGAREREREREIEETARARQKDRERETDRER